MALIRWEPLKEIEELFGRSWPRPALRSDQLMGMGDWNPRVDISENDGQYLVKAALKAAAQEGQLTVTIPKKVPAPSASAVLVPVE